VGWCTYPFIGGRSPPCSPRHSLFQRFRLQAYHNSALPCECSGASNATFAFPRENYSRPEGAERGGWVLGNSGSAERKWSRLPLQMRHRHCGCWRQAGILYGRVGRCCWWMGKPLIIARAEWKQALMIDVWIYESPRIYQTQRAQLDLGYRACNGFEDGACSPFVLKGCTHIGVFGLIGSLPVNVKLQSNQVLLFHSFC